MIPTPAEQDLFNEAFLGFVIASDGLYIRCCAACPGKRFVHALAFSGKQPTPISHGLCVPHFNKQMEELKLA